MSLIALRNEAKALNIENYAELSKADLQAAVDAAKAKQGDKPEKEADYIDPDMKMSEEEKKELADLEAEGKVDILTDPKEIEDPEKAEKKKQKASKKESKEKKPSKAAGVAKKRMSFIPKGDKPEKLGKTAQVIYDELLKNDGRTFGIIAKDISSHYNMVRRVATEYFNITEEALEPAK